MTLGEQKLIANSLHLPLRSYRKIVWDRSVEREVAEMMQPLRCTLDPNVEFRLPKTRLRGGAENLRYL